MLVSTPVTSTLGLFTFGLLILSAVVAVIFYISSRDSTWVYYLRSYFFIIMHLPRPFVIYLELVI